MVAAAALVVGLGEAQASQQGLYGGHAQTVRNRRAAFVDAAGLLARLQVPKDAHSKRTVPRSQLHELEAADNHADVAAEWRVHGTLSSAIGYVRRHRPRGSRFYSSGYSGTPSTVTSRSIAFSWPPVHDVLSDRHLYVSVSSAGHGDIELFAQAESIWLSARPPDERFPASTRQIALRITQPHHPTRARRITRRSTVSRVVALLNAVPITQPVYYSCPAFTKVRAFTYRLLGATGQTLAQVRYQVPLRASPSPCEVMHVAIDGHSRHTLLGGPQVVEVQRIFHIPTDTDSL